MTSILDQHEQASQVSQRPAQMSDQMTSSGYINMQLEDTTPLFSKQKMNFNPSDLITHVAVASDYLVLAMANGKLFRLDLKKPEQHEEIHYTKYVQPNTKLSQIFLDPLGYHLLMAFAAKNKDGNPELVYLHRNNSKLKSVTKSRNYEVTEVGWNYENNSTATTGPILLGTSQGHLLETEFEAENDKIFAASQQYWRQIFDIGQGKEKDSPITGIQFHRVSNTSKYFIFVTTPTRLYQFIGNAVITDGKTSLQSIFHVYLTRPETSFQEIPSSLKYSKLQFFFDKNNTPKTFAWLTEPGIFYGQLDPTSQQNSNSLFTQNDLINYPSDRNDAKEVPLSFVLTEFHALLMYSDRVKAVSLLNQELVYEDHYSEVHGKLKNIIKDPIRKTIFAVTEKTIFRYKVTREERNVWRIYSDKEQFDLAKEYCNNNPAFIDMINVKQAEMLFSRGEYEKSAKVYAETLSSFETVCLKFLQCEKYGALKVYLEKRLEDLDDDKTLISMIVIWMTELYLSELGSLRRDGKQDTQEYHHLQSDFEVFLLQPKVVKCMQLIKSVIYNLMSSHGDKQNLIKLTVINEDYENVVAQNIYTKSYGEALNMLQSLKKPELFYEFVPSLMAEVPQQTVNTLMSQGALLSPVKLLPAFLACENDEKHVTEIIRYLEFMLQNFNVREKAIHNYLLTLYVDHDPQLLMRYLTRQQSQDIASVNYDVHYALRLCREKNLTEACVHLSALLGLWETATELALGVSLSLAKDVARKPDDEELQRTLWLSVAEHVITKNQDLKEAMSLLEECQLIKIEDILPFFSDVVTIDHFRDPICQSLQEYNNQIEELKAEMEDATKSAEYVRQEIQSFRNRSVLVSAGDLCSLCALALLLRPFYLFPCSHRYHADCLRHHTQPLLPPARRNKLAELQRQLSVLTKIELDTVTSSGLPRRDQIKNEIDDIVAAECVFCGEYMIQSIDKPFIADEDWDRMMKEWE